MAFMDFLKRSEATAAPAADGAPGATGAGDDAVGGAEASADAAAGTNPADPTTLFQTMLGLTAEVTPDATVQGFSGAAIGQVVSMIGEDARTFMQSMEQIYMAANGKALALVAEENPAGAKLLTEVANSQAQTVAFMTGAATVAAAFSKL
ncbi:hypothetical protein GCM10007301_32860 [Azorhizobium oxalatiphilum]|uniref:Uncharacterized protein n=1 Tax=Azorhizobium oxalatiphilum TaxID=980631 RepID=A0A917C3W8_9HYPH|nr:hypothetical protein [Azorhizobium oxalatiphilum]GGF70532.1 hypothetical protein GCM10007301_32860 [Azorhizobium oxalatiphilum]